MKKRILAALLVFLMIPACAFPETVKDEVVYALLSAQGVPKQLYVVNSFESDEKTEVVDYGAYESVVNLSDLSALAFADDSVAFTMEEGRFYYQGKPAAAELPWIVSLSYTLDGAAVSPDALGGASGALVLSLSVKANDQADPAFAKACSMQITAALDGELCRHITAPQGTVSLSGSGRTVVFTLLPGTEAAFTISADVADFRMDPVQIAAVPMVPDTEMYVAAFTKNFADSALLPTVEGMIRNMMSGFGGKVGSFMSARNENVQTVQFVLVTESIERPEEDRAEVTAAPESTLWTRILNLFQ